MFFIYIARGAQADPSQPGGGADDLACVWGVATSTSMRNSQEIGPDDTEHVVLQLEGPHVRAETGVTRHEEGQDVVWPSRLGDAGVVLVTGPYYEVCPE